MSQSDDEEKLKQAQLRLAAAQNPVDPPKVFLTFNKKRSLRTLPAALRLPPYTSDPAYTEPEESVVSGEPVQTATSTEYEGRRAQAISFVIDQPIALQPNTEYSYPISRTEDGEITHFTVAVNDPDMRVILTLYDDSQRPDPICNESPNELILLGRGMTHSTAIATDIDGVSLDAKGERHSVMPYVLRFKDTPSYGFSMEEDYERIKGTLYDRWYVIEYEPTLPAPYKKIFFTIKNPTSTVRIIHSARIRRYSFLDRYTQTNPLFASNPSNFPLNQPPTGIVQPGSAAQATLARSGKTRKARITG